MSRDWITLAASLTALLGAEAFVQIYFGGI